MALTVVTPAAGGSVGPGYVVTFSGATGPTALDDIYQVHLISGFSFLCPGTELAHGFTTGAVILGVNHAEIHGPVSMNFPVANGAACSIVLSRSTHAGAFIETTTTAGFVYDQLGGLWVLASRALEAVEGGETSSILAAVRRTYTTP